MNGFSIVCLDCLRDDGIWLESLEQAQTNGWTETRPDPPAVYYEDEEFCSDPEPWHYWTHVGICPECTAENLREAQQQKRTRRKPKPAEQQTQLFS